MKASTGVVAALALLLAGGACAREPRLWTLKEFRAPDYTLLMESATAAPVMIGKLASLDRVLSKLLATEGNAPKLPTYIYVVPFRRWNRYLEPIALGGVYLPARFANYILLDGFFRSEGLRSVAYAEYARLYLRTNFQRHYPFWFERGLSDLVATAVLGRGKAKIGKHPFVWYQTEFSSALSTSAYDASAMLPASLRFPVDEVLLMEPESPAYKFGYYAWNADMQFWALVHRGLVAEPEFGSKLRSYLAARDEMRPLADAIEGSFGISVAQLDAEMNAYSQKSRFKTKQITFEPVPPVVLSKPREVEEGEALEILARAMLDGELKSERVTALVAAAEKESPESIGVQILKMRIAARACDEAGFDRVLANFERQTLSTGQSRDVGLAMLERVRSQESCKDSHTGDLPRLTGRAMELLDAAIRAQPEDLDATWGFGLLAARSKRNLDLALTRLERASLRLPRSADLAMARAMVHEALGNRDSLLANLIEVVRFSRDHDERLRAARRIDELRDGGAQATD